MNGIIEIFEPERLDDEYWTITGISSFDVLNERKHLKCVMTACTDTVNDFYYLRAAYDCIIKELKYKSELEFKNHTNAIDLYFSSYFPPTLDPYESIVGPEETKTIKKVNWKLEGF